MANIDIKYKGLTGIVNDLTIDNGQTMAQLRTAIIADEGLTAGHYGLVSIHKTGTIVESTGGSSTTLDNAGIVADDIITVATARQASKQAYQTMSLDIAQLKRGTAGQPYTRALAEYDITELPAPYKTDTSTSSPNSEGLLAGRPWSASGMTLDELVMFLDPFYASSGTTVYDQTTNTNNATLINGTGHNQAITPNAFTFDGVNDYIRSPNLYSAIGNPDTFSVGAWVRPAAAGVVVDISTTTTPNGSYHFSAMEFVESGGNPVPHFGVWTGVGIGSDSGSALSYDTWYYMSLSYNAGTNTLKGYINGSEVASASANYASLHDDSITNQYLLFGAEDVTNMGSGAYFTGRMGEIRVYNKALSAVEVLANYNTSKTRYGY